MSSSNEVDSSYAERTTQEVITLLEERGTGDYIGESISQLEHSLQCAHFAKQAGRPDETVIAALLHDIGQFLPVDETKDIEMSIEGSSVGRIGHEKIGEEYLRSLGFSENVCHIVGSHVAAKRLWSPFIARLLSKFSCQSHAETHSRYLTAVDSSYYNGLSDASKKSLSFQGGPFEGKELEAFEYHPLKDEMVRVRKWDDMSKVVGIILQTPRTATYKEMIRKHLERREN